MNKEKTAMQTLIEEIESLANKFQPNTDSKRIYLGLRKKIINDNLLKKEQDQIENAYEDGIDDGREIEGGYGAFYNDKQDYYKYKYGGESC